MEQRTNIKMLCYFTSHKQRRNHGKLLRTSFSQFSSFFIKDMELTTHNTDDANFQETVTQGNVLLHHICKVLNTNSWIIPDGMKTSAVVKKSCISIKRIHSHYKETETVKDRLVTNQWSSIFSEYANQYFKVSMLEPLNMRGMLYKNMSLFSEYFLFC